MLKQTQTHEFASGTIIFEASVDGSIDRKEALVEAMLGSAVAAASTAGYQYRVTTNGHQEESRSRRPEPLEFTWATKSGEIEVQFKTTFELNHSTSKRAINSLVYLEILPAIEKTVGRHIGLEQTLSPQLSLSASIDINELLRGGSRELVGVSAS